MVLILIRRKFINLIFIFFGSEFGAVPKNSQKSELYVYIFLKF